MDYILSDALSINGELLNDIHGHVYADKTVVNVQDLTFAEKMEADMLLKAA